MSRLINEELQDKSRLINEVLHDMSKLSKVESHDRADRVMRSFTI
jgi:hypothetical protein